MTSSGPTIYPARVVRTMDPARPTAEAVAVVGDRVRAVGSLAELSTYGPAEIDDRYADAVLLPGFVEAHTHVKSGGMWQHTFVGYHERMSPDGRRWPGCRSIDDVIARLREADASLPGGEPLLAWGLDPIFFPGERLDRRHLDRVSTTRPIVVTHQSGHLSTVSSVVIEADRIADADVEGVVRDGSGEPTGELQEPPAMSLVRSVATTAVLGFDKDSAWSFGADARNHGVTTAVDLGSTVLMEDSGVEGYRSVVDHPDFPTRLVVFHVGAGFGGTADPADAVPRLEELRKTNSDKLRFGHVKLFIDGSIQGFTARLQAPGYLPDDRQGIWILGPDEFAGVFSVFHRAGMNVHVHCNGDAATEVFVDAVEAALIEHPWLDHRHTVTHSQLTTPAQYRRMARLGMCANIFSNHIYYWGDQHRDLILGPDRASRMNAAATALREGVPISLHCDTPVTPLDPLATMSHAVTRRTTSGQVLGEHERITVPQALHAMTLGSAYMLHLDHEVGSIEAGKYADLAILDRDPWDCPGEELTEIEVLGTMMGGRA